MTFNRFIDEPIIKKLSLFYDSIYIGEGRFNIIRSTDPNNLNEENIPMLYEKAVWEFLQDNEVVKTYPYIREKFDSEDEDVKELSKQLEQLFLKEQSKGNFPETPSEEQLFEMKKDFFQHLFLTHDISIRLDTLHLRKTDDFSEYYPLLRTPDTLKSENKKTKIIQFLLDKIPEPDYTVSWDHIIEYRSDEDVRNKYFALTNWVNKAANSNSKLSEIKDEYEYLYSEYMKQFKLHKMKYNNSLIEIIVNATTNFLLNITTGNYVSSVKDLIQFKIKNAALLQEESKIQGKEIAYIFHTKKEFSK